VAIPAVDKTGKDKDGNAVADLPGGSDLLNAVFESDVGLENAPVQTGGDGYVWYDVTAVTQARDRDLSEVKDKVAAAWKRDKTEEKLTAKANEVRDRLAKGEDIAKVATDLGVAVKTADALTRATKPNGDLTAATILRTFAGPKGSAAVAAGAADQTKLVLVVTDTTVPPYFSGAPEMAGAQQQFSQQLTNDLLVQYITQLQGQLGVTVNQSALAQAIGVSQPGT
jgi:peptidyl-prolyl cis-trans isomerase D